MTDPTLGWLRDRAEVTDTVLRFANAMDRQDWAALRACLADQLEIDYSALRGEAPRTVSAEEYVAGRVSGLAGLRTQHVSTNHVVTVAGDRAECVSAFLIHRLDPARPPESQTFDTAGHYRHGLTRAGNGWRIDRIVQTVLWSRGKPRRPRRAARAHLGRIPWPRASSRRRGRRSAASCWATTTSRRSIATRTATPS